MQTPIEFLFDFASPNAYLSYHVLKDVAERHDAALSLTPVLLGGLFKLTNNQAPMQAFADVKGKLDYDMLETQRFIAAHRLDRFRFNPYFPINTIKSTLRNISLTIKITIYFSPRIKFIFRL